MTIFTLMRSKTIPTIAEFAHARSLSVLATANANRLRARLATQAQLIVNPTMCSASLRQHPAVRVISLGRRVLTRSPVQRVGSEHSGNATHLRRNALPKGQPKPQASDKHACNNAQKAPAPILDLIWADFRNSLELGQGLSTVESWAYAVACVVAASLSLAAFGALSEQITAAALAGGFQVSPRAVSPMGERCGHASLPSVESRFVLQNLARLCGNARQTPVEQLRL